MRTDLVVIGLGYAGLPFAPEACPSGVTVADLARGAKTVALLDDSRSRVRGMDDSAVADMCAAGVAARTGGQVIVDASTAVAGARWPCMADRA